MENQRPENTIRLGRIKAVIWKNVKDDVTRFNVTVCRIYSRNCHSKTVLTLSFPKRLVDTVAF